MTIPGYTRTVITPQGRETFQVWLEKDEGGWVARIVTLPNRMWVQPGGREALKFRGQSREDAESEAASFIESERVARGIRAAGPAEAAPATLERIAQTARVLPVRPEAGRPAQRIPHRLLLRFGIQRPDHPGVTANLSETGLFIITDQPRQIGASIEIDLRFSRIPVFVGGEVVWISGQRVSGRSVGFGVRLVRRPGEYLEHLKALAPRTP